VSWSAAVNVALGLILLYLVFSLAASRINESVASRLQWRAKGLERALFTMLGGDAPPVDSIATKMDGTPANPMEGMAAPAGTAVLSAQAVKDHPIVAAFESSLAKNRRISYLPARAFSAVVLDILAPPAAVIAASIPGDDLDGDAARALAELQTHSDSNHLDSFQAALDQLPSERRATVLPRVQPALPRLRAAIDHDPLAQARATVVALPPSNPARRPLLRMLTDAGTDRDKFRAKLEHWYDDEMSRLTGWYKRRVQRFIIGYSIALTLLFNVDTIAVTQNLWRAPVEQAAAAQAAATAAGQTVDKIDTSVTAIKGLAMPLGWSPLHEGTALSTDPRHFPASLGAWLLKVLGLAITVFALAFGAPFWFDLLGKVARVRNAGGVAASTDDSSRP
jgi:hypothetical protein